MFLIKQDFFKKNAKSPKMQISRDEPTNTTLDIYTVICYTIYIFMHNAKEE